MENLQHAGKIKVMRCSTSEGQETLVSLNIEELDKVKVFKYLWIDRIGWWRVEVEKSHRLS